MPYVAGLSRINNKGPFSPAFGPLVVCWLKKKKKSLKARIIRKGHIDAWNILFSLKSINVYSFTFFSLIELRAFSLSRNLLIGAHLSCKNHTHKPLGIPRISLKIKITPALIIKQNRQPRKSDPKAPVYISWVRISRARGLFICIFNKCLRRLLSSGNLGKHWITTSGFDFSSLFLSGENIQKETCDAIFSTYSKFNRIIFSDSLSLSKVFNFPRNNPLLAAIFVQFIT